MRSVDSQKAHDSPSIIVITRHPEKAGAAADGGDGRHRAERGQHLLGIAAVVVRALLHGFDRRLDGAEAGHDDGEDVGLELGNFFQQPVRRQQNLRAKVAGVSAEAPLVYAPI